MNDMINENKVKKYINDHHIFKNVTEKEFLLQQN
jgi:hypothetical protein